LIEQGLHPSDCVIIRQWPSAFAARGEHIQNAVYLCVDTQKDLQTRRIVGNPVDETVLPAVARTTELIWCDGP
jgi:hypothetical protein